MCQFQITIHTLKENFTETDTYTLIRMTQLWICNNPFKNTPPTQCLLVSFLPVFCVLIHFNTPNILLKKEEYKLILKKWMTKSHKTRSYFSEQYSSRVIYLSFNLPTRTKLQSLWHIYTYSVLAFYSGTHSKESLKWRGGCLKCPLIFHGDVTPLIHY